MPEHVTTPVSGSGPPLEREPCVHDSQRVDGTLDDHCSRCGIGGHWHEGHRHDRRHPSGKLLIEVVCGVTAMPDSADRCTECRQPLDTPGCQPTPDGLPTDLYRALTEPGLMVSCPVCGAAAHSPCGHEPNRERLALRNTIEGRPTVV